MVQVFAADRIYTMDSPNEYYRAMLVEEGKITRLLDRTTYQSEKASLEPITILSGFIFPGFIDSHIHAISYGKYIEYVNLRDVQSIEEMIEKITKKVRKTPETEWIYGIAWNQENFEEQRYPTKDDLDRISTKHPILLKRVCTHVVLINSVILEKAGITHNTPDPEGGVIDRNPDGSPTGILRENAMDLITPLEPHPSFSDQIRWQKLSQKHLNSYGITSIQTLDEESYSVYRHLKNELTIRVYFCPKLKNLPKIHQEDSHAKTGVGDEMLRVGRIKLFADGSLGAQTAAMREPYIQSDNRGIPIYSKEKLTELVKILDAQGWQIEIHAIGDKAAEIVLDCYESIYRSNYRPVITHCQVLAIDLIRRMAKFEVIASIQPFFIEQDMDFVEKFIGHERMKYAYAWKTLQDYEVRCCGGSDAPVDPPNPLHGIYAAVTRKKMDGTPAKGWIPEQNLSIWDAFRLYTYGGAYAEFQEHQKGALKPGYLADFIVLDRDPFRTVPTEIKNIHVLKTFLGGKEVYTLT